jgi:hypothetical protein
MKPIGKRLFSLILALMVLSLFTGEVQAADYGGWGDSLIVSVESADYTDLDNDLVEDDILTEFSISVPYGDWNFQHTYIYCELVMPSGNYFNCLLLLIGSYNSVTISLAWYNTASESGWYTFSLWSWGEGFNAPDLGYDSVVFDPPTEELPGLPTLEIIDIIAD